MIKNEVPQGSILGTVLYDIYIQDLQNVNIIRKYYLYAYDFATVYAENNMNVWKHYHHKNHLTILGLQQEPRCKFCQRAEVMTEHSLLSFGLIAIARKAHLGEDNLTFVGHTNKSG